MHLDDRGCAVVDAGQVVFVNGALHVLNDKQTATGNGDEADRRVATDAEKPATVGTRQSI